ncbi:MAG TPA: hypothetical protein VHC90_25615 [Bryobacteraceae bacterium]|nr:hypothetical protein [Bryobacteraceae bacterium]
MWNVFGLPVFEQVLGLDGGVIAEECETHQGLHAEHVSVDPADSELVVMGQQTGYSAEIVTVHCDCGRETPRLRNLARLQKQASATAA